jgi:CheY-like chemotaxis protein
MITVDLHGRCILVVEDEAMVAMLMESALCDAGAAVIGPATNVADAIALLARAPQLDAALLDLNLDGEMSTPVAAALAQRGVPFVVVTAYGASVVPEAERLAAAVVRKPYDPDEVIAQLNRIFRPT